MRSRRHRLLSLLTVLVVAPGLTTLGTVEARPVAAAPAPPTGHLTALSVNQLRGHPLGVDTKPRFGWQLHDAGPALQTAYQVRVTALSPAGTPAERVWDSGRVASSASVAVAYGGPRLQRATAYRWQVRSWLDTSSTPTSWSSPATFETGLMSTDGRGGWGGAHWIGAPGNDAPGGPAVMLRRDVRRLPGRVVSARLYASALGTYEAYVGGHRVGPTDDGHRVTEVLTPGWTEYDRTTDYFTYDVTDLLPRSRHLTLAAVLGHGWYDGRISRGARYHHDDGDPLAFKAELVLRYADGRRQVVVTAPHDGWTTTRRGPITANDLYDGQTTDARLEQPGWDRPGLRPGHGTGWTGAVVHDLTDRFPHARLVAYPATSARLVPRWSRRPVAVDVVTGVTGRSSSANGLGHVVTDPARSTTDPTAARRPLVLHRGEHAIVDLGQETTGFPRFTVQGPRGATVTMTFAEARNDASATADGPAGSAYRANLRSAKATSTYVLAGNPHGETHQDSTTFYGYRYVDVRVTGTDRPVTISGLVGMVATSATRQTTTFSTDDPDVQRLATNIAWSERGTYLWVPMDSPQRDERLGWTGDAQVFARTALYGADVAPLLARYEDTLVDGQATYGEDHAAFPAVAPGARGNRAGARFSGWGDAGIVVPWQVWQMTGDLRVVRDHWTAMTRYLDWQTAHAGPDHEGPGSRFGDWLAPQQTSTQLLSTVYYAYDAQLMAAMATATGHDSQARTYQRLFDQIRAGFIARYVVHDDAGRASVRSSLGDPGSDTNVGEPARAPEDDSQTALLWVLKLGLCDPADRADLEQRLVDDIGNGPDFQAAHPSSTRLGYAADTLAVGFLGIHVLEPVLSDLGRVDVAYALLHQHAFPSWLQTVDDGATTTWERWNAHTPDGFGPASSGSFDHAALGSVGEWLDGYVAGIRPDPERPGFAHVLIEPHPDPTVSGDGGLGRAGARVATPYGDVVSRWQRSGDVTDYTVEVPGNATATLTLQADDAARLTSDGTPVTDVPGVRLVSDDGAIVVLDLRPGHYEIEDSGPSRRR